MLSRRTVRSRCGGGLLNTQRGRLIRILLPFGVVGLLLLFAAPLLRIDGAGLASHWLAAAHGPWGLPVAVVVFAVLAFVGVPQFVLIAAAAVAFGPWYGGLYSWIGTMVSALIGFAVGRFTGAPALAALNNTKLDRFTAQIARNGFLASLIARLVPFAPFIIINMAAGAARVGLRDYVAGTAIGIIPKIALTALAGGAAWRLVQTLFPGG